LKARALNRLPSDAIFDRRPCRSAVADSGISAKIKNAMSTPHPALPVKLVLSAIYSSRPAWAGLRSVLEEKFGLIDYASKEMEFGFTDYYASEMGAPLFRQFLGFNQLIKPEELPAIKLFTNSLEQKYSENARRQVNLDPGYLSLDALVLATGKHSPHRIYLRDGIWADLHLLYRGGSFKPLEWTYPDYGSEPIIELCNRLRESLKARLKKRETGHDE